MTQEDCPKRNISQCTQLDNLIKPQSIKYHIIVLHIESSKKVLFKEEKIKLVLPLKVLQDNQHYKQ